MNEKIPMPQEEGPTPRQMLQELAPIFHPDRGGDKKLMQDLNAAYELARRKGDSRQLRKIYREWTSDEAQKKEKIREAMVKESGKLLEEIKKDPRNAPFYREDYLRRVYSNLCKKNDLPPDNAFITQFLYDEGWINEKRYNECLEELTRPEIKKSK